MRVAFKSSLLCAVLAIACASEPPTSQKDLSGVIRDRLSGKRISGASVRFQSDTLYSASTRTDDDGHYEMVVESDTPLGQVRAEHADYQPSEKTVFFDTNERVIDIDLLPVPSDDD